MKNDLYVVIMAGGQGSRLWPLSQTKTPKQFLDLVGIGQTMLQMTYSRFEGVCPPENFVVVTNVDYEDLVREQLPKVPRENILCEPFRKNTTACIVYANTFIKQRNKNALIMVTPCDHFIVNETSFVESVREGVKYVSDTDDVLLTVGVNAHRPETLFGYIQLGSKVEGDYENVYSVKTFTEKPNEEMAQLFYESGDFCWNTGVFVWKLSSIERALDMYMKGVTELFTEMYEMPRSMWSPNIVKAVYNSCPNMSIDYAVMENARNVYVVQTDAIWSDMGSWDAVYDQNRRDAEDNAILDGKVIVKETKGCLIRVPKKKMCIIEGLEDYMVVESDDVLLICPRSGGGASWKYVAEMEEKML